eukprot:TRINITY_DN44465_c0_g1_i1.p1 TRINITY_DN44465_c0_g1~~TRINITY_DN44465_c0_g1_i1.p1  ORF type:complete len:154 (-),score=11.49 TRINITY_DN44465_c0_g1_i1:65-487(-)
MLNYSCPNLMQLNSAIDHFSTRRRVPVFTISKTERFPTPGGGRRTTSTSPGMYRMDSSLPVNEQSEVLATRLTRNARSPKYSFGRESRAAQDEFLKGISPQFGKEVSALGPGQYPQVKMGSRVNKASSPSYSVPRSVSFS